MIHLAGLSLPLVFAAGIVSVASPCVLPLVPGYLSIVAGYAGPEGVATAGSRGRILRGSGLFFAGFLAAFIALGASASAAGQLLASHRIWLDRAAGIAIALFALSLVGLGSSSGALGRWNAFAQRLARRRGGPVAVGAAFAFSWTPCVGPVLASILAFAGSAASLKSGVALLGVYGLGLTVPFLIVGLGFTRVVGALKAVRRHYRTIELASAGMLLALAALLLTDRLFLLNAYAQRALDAVGLNWWATL